MIKQSKFIHRGEIFTITFHMADKEIRLENYEIGYFNLDELQDSYTKEFSALRENKKAGRMALVISQNCIGENEWILSHHQNCAIYSVTVLSQDRLGNNVAQDYNIADAWLKCHSVRVTSKGQLQVLVGADGWEFADRYESLPNWWFWFNGEIPVSNTGAVLYTDNTPAVLKQSHYQIYSDSMYELTQLIEDAKVCFKARTKAKVIMLLSIFDLYSQQQGKTYDIEKYTYLDSFGTPRNLRVENVWRNCSKEYTRIPPADMRVLASKLKNKSLSQLMDIRGDIICAKTLGEGDIDEIFDSL